MYRDELREVVRGLKRELREESKARDKKVFLPSHLLCFSFKLHFKLSKTRALLEERKNILMTVSEQSNNIIGADKTFQC